MNPAQYTPDAICSSMGLPAFVEPGWAPPTLRLLLKPSFDPEVCVTLSGPAEDARLSVVALAEMLWRKPGPIAMPAWRDSVTVPAPVIAQALADFAAALAEYRQPDGKVLLLDGMPVAACLLTPSGLEQFASHPYRHAVRGFVALVIQLAWESCRVAGVRNALAKCGRYVDLKFPRVPVPPVPDLFRVAVLGTSEVRAEFLGQLQS